jgi:hypothetical protein
MLGQLSYGKFSFDFHVIAPSSFMNTPTAIVSKKKQNVTILSMHNISFDADNIYKAKNSSKLYSYRRCFMKKHRIYILALCLCFLCALGACGRDKNDSNNNSATNPSQNQTTVPTPTTMPTVTTAPDNLGDGVIDGIEDVGDGIMDGTGDVIDGVGNAVDDIGNGLNGGDNGNGTTNGGANGDATR